MEGNTNEEQPEEVGRLKTISKHFYDDEILFKDPITNDLHLKEGVRRVHKFIELDSKQEKEEQFTIYDINTEHRDEFKNLLSNTINRGEEYEI